MFSYVLYFDDGSGLPKIQKKIFEICRVESKELLILFDKKPTSIFLIIFGFIKFFISVLKRPQTTYVVGSGGLAAIISICNKFRLQQHKLIYIQHTPIPTRGVLANHFFCWVVRSADAFVVISLDLKKFFLDNFNLEGHLISTIYNPVLLDGEVKKDFLSASQIDIAGEVRLISVGRLSYQKDVPLLLEAAMILKCELPGLTVDVFGEGEQQSELEGLIQKSGASSWFRLRGQVDNVTSEMERAHCFLLHSRWEGLPTVLIEALAYCPRVVSVDIPTGPREILLGGKAGFLTPSRLPVDIAKTVLFALRSPIKDSKERALHRFSIAVARGRYEEIFRSVS